jgi:hypothetical protein
MLAAIFWLGGSMSFAAEVSLPAKLHPWGQFDPGVWKTVHVVTEMLDEHGHVVSTSVADTKTTLTDIDNDGVTLEIQACMDVAGKRFETEPQTVKQGFHGEVLGANLKLNELPDDKVAIEGRKIPCKVCQFEVVSSAGKTVTTLYYSTIVAPYILKRNSVTTNSQNVKLGETTVEAIVLDMPLKIQEELKSGIYVKTVHESNANGTVTTLATVLPDVPGGVISSSTKEVDKSGRLVRRSTLELVDYNNDPDQDRKHVRKRSSRHHGKPSSPYTP